MNINLDDLAHLMIYLAAIIVWALSDRDKDLYQAVKEQGLIKWKTIKEEYEKP
jgi:hypothetical protein